MKYAVSLYQDALSFSFTWKFYIKKNVERKWNSLSLDFRLFRFCEQSDELLFDLYIDIVLIVYMFYAKILFFKGWYEKIVKRGDAQGGKTNK